MEEKNLSDEEIVKDIERSTGMPSYWKTIVLDLIHRLQDKNAKQKKELDRLKKFELYRIKEMKKQKAEIERLTEENGQLKGYNDGLEYENAELQKQVDELKS